MSVRVNSESFESEVLNAEGIIIADFYSDSCVPCKRMSPLLAEIEESENVKLVKININFDPELTEKYEIQAAPTLVFFKDGAEVSRLRGAVKKAEILEAINAIN